MDFWRKMMKFLAIHSRFKPVVKCKLERLDALALIRPPTDPLDPKSAQDFA